MADARTALHELREHFEQKRDQHIRAPDDDAHTERAIADAYNHAMEMVANYIRELPKP